ncbi:DNA polymerasee III beta subunit [Prochlorococcus marinus str. MIT 9321]|uniref:Beta sliding clamp n=1 Tax=Prochlorococcus marinus str. MIT 9401 TaxID=167551 RepID=A0A0A2B206_PROMR|nr:DNA polymerase III subunit beta [Prochlorococcus marinus]KGG03290.1 DNA polymerasee III beta subunit [Prochlorococcus marinus str. MIT 9321]KGG06071.1 DNA polymerasee III beta subunit [Prochlorococcus marinus str. MIT 9322]KGG06644.1 DNA polymerasee III beta subunit [Prochlorococcus marinus str. MIT 9401]
MEIICNQNELNNAIQLVSKAVASRPTHPILANILLTADQGTNKISLTGFDLNLGIQTSFDGTVKNSGAITIPSKLLSEIVNKLPNETPVNLEVDQNSENILIKSDRGSFNLKGIPSDDYPNLPFVESGTSLNIDPISFLKALKSTIFASSNDDSKQLLTGVNFTFKQNYLESASTDGHRLAVALIGNEEYLKNIQNKDNLTSDENDLSVTIPTRSLREIEKLVTLRNSENLLKFFYDKGQVVFISTNQLITTRTLEGNYPNYSQLIPDTFSKILNFNTKRLIEALERIAVLADQQSSVVKFKLDNTDLASISADAQDIGNANESIPVSYSGDDFEIAFNVRYLLEGLKVITSENVILKCNLATTPAVFVPEDNLNSFTYLVMPVQVRS